MRSVIFMFHGQGSQRVAMGVRLADNVPAFASAFRECADVAKPLGVDLSAILRGEGGDLNRPAVAQPFVFAYEWSLAAVWRSVGVVPRVVIGHSLGDFAAVALAGMVSLEDAVRMVVLRGQAMAACPDGGMLIVPLPEKEVCAALNEDLSLASVNAPNSCVVAGPEVALAAIEKEYFAAGVHVRRLPVSKAFHSRLMAGAAERMPEIVRSVRFLDPDCDVISNVTGAALTREEASTEAYWVEHLLKPVRFADGVSYIARTYDNPLWLEIGPRLMLGKSVCAEIGDDAEVLPSIEGSGDEFEELQSAYRYLRDCKVATNVATWCSPP
jgi:acyl transferase domain-containing protein